MEDGWSSDLELEVEEEIDVSPETNFSPNLPSSKKSRRSVKKRVVSIPIAESETSRTKGNAGEGSPPSDCWTWRKYGQKPIKGSPYPRAYYRCSSWKGCPARKQVERSRDDPLAIVVAYSFEHCHPWPLQKKNANQNKNKGPRDFELSSTKDFAGEPPAPAEQGTEFTVPENGERDDKMLEFVGDEGGEFRWCSPSSDDPSGCSDELLYGSVASSEAVIGWPEERGEIVAGEEDSLFAGLEELPEYTVVFRRGVTSALGVGTTG